MLSFEMKKLGGDSLSEFRNHYMLRTCITNLLFSTFLIQSEWWLVYRQRAAAKGQEAEAGRRKQPPAPDGNSGLQVLGIHLKYQGLFHSFSFFMLVPKHYWVLKYCLEIIELSKYHI